MKSSHVLASLLFSGLGLAVPVQKRDLVTKTEVVMQTVVVFTTIYDDEIPSAAAATSTAGAFYEQPSKPASLPVVPTSTAAAYTPPVVPSSAVVVSSVVIPTPVVPVSSAPAFTPSSVVAPPPPPPSSAPVYTPSPSPVVVPSSVYTPAPVSSAAAPPPAASSSAPSSGSGAQHSGDITIYDNTGADGACGKPLTDDMEICAMNTVDWGQSTYDVMTGAATNKWCGKTVTLTYKGNTASCVVQDLCPVCKKGDVDLSAATWFKLTGTHEKTRYQATWTSDVV